MRWPGPIACPTAAPVATAALRAVAALVAVGALLVATVTANAAAPRRVTRAAPAARATPTASAEPAPRAGQTIAVMVVGRTRVLRSARNLRLPAGTVPIGRRRCAVPAGTALAGLLATRLRIRVTDRSGCDPAGMFVTRIGPDRNRGQAGWEYKVGNADPSSGAGDLTGRLHPGRQATLLWYWCGRAGDCQRTLVVSGSFAGTADHVLVRGYDQNGHGIPIAGASVHYGRELAVTDAQGHATLPLITGQHQLYATKPGLVRSFPTTVGVVA